MSTLLEQASLVLIPSGIKASKVYCEIPEDGSGDMTFSRASDATRINSLGLVEKVRTNLLPYSNDFGQSVWVIGIGGGSLGSFVTDPFGGSTARVLNLNSNGIFFNGSVSPYPTSISTTSIWMRAQSGSFSIQLGNPNGSPYYTKTITTTWQRFDIQVDPSSFNGGPAIYNSVSGTSVTLEIYGAQVEVSDFGPTAYIPTTSSAVSVGPYSNIPRLNYQNGGGGCPSLLLEAQRTNLQTYSENFTQWSASNATVTANQTTSPDGYQNADRVQFTGAGYLLGTTQSSGSVYTISCYAKRNGSGTQSVGFFKDGSGVVDSAWALTSEWQRFTYTYTASNGSYSGIAGVNGGDVFVWGAQLEAGSYSSSYIPTLGTSVTRVADGIPDKTTLLTDKLSYSVFLDFYPRPLGLFQYFFIQMNSSGNSEIIWGGTSGGTDFAIYDYTSGSICNVAINDGNRHKIVLSQASGKIDVFVDGSQVATQKTTSATGFYYFAINGNPGIYKINELVLLPKITSAQAIELTTL
jgi:hypothetical protein